jgi:hypothetical protein
MSSSQNTFVQLTTTLSKEGINAYNSKIKLGLRIATMEEAIKSQKPKRPIISITPHQPSKFSTQEQRSHLQNKVEELRVAFETKIQELYLEDLQTDHQTATAAAAVYTDHKKLSERIAKLVPELEKDEHLNVVSAITRDVRIQISKYTAEKEGPPPPPAIAQPNAAAGADAPMDIAQPQQPAANALSLEQLTVMVQQLATKLDATILGNDKDSRHRPSRRESAATGEGSRKKGQPQQQDHRGRSRSPKAPNPQRKGDGDARDSRNPSPRKRSSSKGSRKSGK